jgi:DNA-binding MarR family transcriptional regulator
MTTPQDPIRQAHHQWRRHGWDAAADGMAMITSLVRAHQLLMERIDAQLRPLDLTFARFEILRLLSFVRSGSMSMTRLGSLLQVHPTSVTSAVERLVRQGYVVRLRREDDRRVILASLTDQGRDIVETATESLNREVFERPGLEGDEVLRLTELLRDLRADAGDHVDKAAAPT